MKGIMQPQRPPGRHYHMSNIDYSVKSLGTVFHVVSAPIVDIYVQLLELWHVSTLLCRGVHVAICAPLSGLTVFLRTRYTW